MPSLKPLMLFMLVLLLASCNGEAAPPTTGVTPPTSQSAQPSDTPLIPPTQTPIPPPTATPVPLAAVVNGEPLTLAEYQAELARYNVSMTESGSMSDAVSMSDAGTELATDAQQVVLDELVGQMLLAQAARAQGFVVDDAALQARLDALSAQLGGTGALQEWLTAYGYTEADFRMALRRSVEAAWMRDQLAAGVADTAEQVHARQILLYNSDQANQVYSLLESGNDFAALAADYAPQTLGDLGWFPRGYLTQPALEEVAFSLLPGQYSPVIETELGFHILQVIEVDPQHTLTPDARLALQLLALQNWLQASREQSTIEILLP